MQNSFFNPYVTMGSGKARGLMVGSLVTFIAIWSAIAASGVVSKQMLPSPLDIVQALSYLSWHEGRSLLWEAIVPSVGRVMAAGLLVISIGVPVGILMGASPAINGVFSPLLDPFRSAPIVAFLPLFVMWFGIGESMKVLFLFSGAVVYLIPMTRDAIRSVPASYYRMAKDLGATDWECVTKTLVPLALPRIADAIIVSFSIIWTYITVAEYVNAQNGLGQLIQNARRFSAMDQVCAGILVIVVLALLTHFGMQTWRRHAFKWETAR
jgi:ABC-type nitrate/sulfonate/bicarbonate transport system permease component